jgi:biopolymer transport protein ExbB/TolQ
VTRQAPRGSLAAIVSNLGWPLLLGGGLCGAFFALLFQGPLNTPLMIRYFAGHPINMTTTVLFFVGLAALLIKLLDVVRQYSMLGEISLPQPPAGGQRVDQVGELLDLLANLPERAQQSYLGQRLTRLLETIERKGNTDGLGDEVKYLADMDAIRQQDSYALVRIVIWAAPMLGFLGTVVGITDALGDLGNEFATNSEAANNIAGAMNGLLSGLYVAFDTTAQALFLSMILMFLQFLCDRMESQLLSTIDTVANEEMVGRFQELGGASDPHLTSIQRMIEGVVRATELLVDRQAALWQRSLSTAEEHWQQTLEKSGDQLQTALTTSLQHSLHEHAEALARVEQQSTEALAARWEQWQAALGENTRALVGQQAEMIRQGQSLSEAVKATGEVIQLEHALNANLTALAGARHFEEMVASLAAAVNLLSAKTRGGEARNEASSLSIRGRAA